MLQGLLHHDTDIEIEANITDTHGASIVVLLDPPRGGLDGPVLGSVSPGAR